MFFFFPETQFNRKFITNEVRDGSLDENGQAKEGGVNENGEPKEAVVDKDAAVETTAEVATTPKKTYLQELKPWSPINHESNLFHLFLRPWPLSVYPAVIFATLIFSVTLAWLVVVLNTSASIFQGPHYHMKPGIASLINVPAVIGIFLGSFVGGPLTDIISTRIAKRRNGVFEPEYRLISLIFPLIFVPVGLLMYVFSIHPDIRYGFGVQRLESWAVAWIGGACINFGLAAVPAIVMTYGTFHLRNANSVIDCYYPVAFDALLIVNGVKNMFAFGFSYGVIPWIQRSGYEQAFGEMVVIQTGVMLFAIPLYIYGKQLRHISAGWKVISW
jgi:hypothetical protein